MTYFQTDRSGKTWHIASPRGLDLTGECGVTVRGTQSYRQTNERPAHVCPRCRARTR